MRAIAQERYGEPAKVLRLGEIDRPEPGEGQVLVRVHAAGLHRGDCFVVRGKPFLMRMATGWLRPKVATPGFDIAGVVEAVGPGVMEFSLGNEVFGSTEGASGACAEFALAKASSLVQKPGNISFEEAAAVPTSALAALHGLRVGNLQAGQSVLINGASGGVGSFAVQIAKALGADVTGVCSTKNLQTVRTLGADRAIDYTSEDFADGSARYDLILDNVENRSLGDLRRALKSRGTVILNSGSGASGLKLIWRLFKPMLVGPFVGQSLKRYLSVPKPEDLETLRRMLEGGQITPVIARGFALEDTAEAFGQLCAGHVAGKLVIRIG